MVPVERSPLVRRSSLPSKPDRSQDFGTIRFLNERERIHMGRRDRFSGDLGRAQRFRCTSRIEYIDDFKWRLPQLGEWLCLS